MNIISFTNAVKTYCVGSHCIVYVFVLLCLNPVGGILRSVIVENTKNTLSSSSGTLGCIYPQDQMHYAQHHGENES